MSANTLKIWRRFASVPGGKWAFSKLVCHKAPYFSSINPLFEELSPGICKIRIAKCRAVQNHLGTVHAIAMCNMAELSGGTMTEVTVPTSLRWIPSGMSVKYLKKANTDLVAIARPVDNSDWSTVGENKVKVDVYDLNNELVFQALISMWVSPRK